MKKNLLLAILFLLAVPLVFVPAESKGADTTPPTFCGIGDAICGHLQAEIDWFHCPATDESPPITYNVYWSTVSGGQDFSTPNATTTDLIYWPTLEPWVTYYFVVRAEDSLGYEDTNTVEMSCTPQDQSDWDQDGFVDVNWGGDDCNDGDPNINPAAVEDCTDLIDNDCDNLIDAQDPDAVGCPPTCTDGDGDTYNVETQDCGVVDCNDSDASINPGAVEDCTDYIDNDCDNNTDCDDSECIGDPACQGTVCSDYTDKTVCNEDLNCEWSGSPKNGTCQDAAVCVPDQTPEATCTDGVDNDCDGLTDCADTADCGADPACQGGSCDTYTDKTSCQSNGCTWSNKDRVCM